MSQKRRNEKNPSYFSMEALQPDGQLTTCIMLEKPMITVTVIPQYTKLPIDAAAINSSSQSKIMSALWSDFILSYKYKFGVYRQLGYEAVHLR